MIVTAAAPRVGDTVQAGDVGEHTGQLVTPGARFSLVAVDGGNVLVDTRTLYLLTSRIVAVTDPDDPHGPPAWEGPIERAAEHLAASVVEATSEAADETVHIGWVLVTGNRQTTWLCRPSCDHRSNR